MLFWNFRRKKDKNSYPEFRIRVLIPIAWRNQWKIRFFLNWHSKEITIVQHKTGKSLSFPLFADVGNAVSEYIFLSTKAPYNKLSDHATSIVQHNLNKAGLTYNSKLRKGFHSFRRTVGTQMQKSNVPLPIISQALGHSSMESTKPYLCIDFSGLKNCTLDWSAISVLRGVL